MAQQSSTSSWHSVLGRQGCAGLAEGLWSCVGLWGSVVQPGVRWQSCRDLWTGIA